MYKLTKRKIIYILAIVFAVLQLFLNRNQLPKISLLPTITITPTIINYSEPVKVIRVVDGDTIEIEGNIKVRYIGINTPEFIRDTTGKKTGEDCFAQESYLENKKLVEGKTVRLEKDISETDKYGRLLRYVYINDPSTSSGQVIFVNDYLIKNGFAKIMTIKPDIKFSQQFKIEEKEAKQNNLGIWKNCPIATPTKHL